MKGKRAWGGDFAETNALAFGEDGTAENRVHHVEKHKQKRKGLEVVFDPEAHREYLTGFHKRKLDRRNKAKREIAAKERKQKLEDRAEKRARLRESLNLERYETPPQSDADSEGTGEAAGKNVRVYQGDDTVTTVVTASVFLDDEVAGAAPANIDSDQDEGAEIVPRVSAAQTPKKVVKPTSAAKKKRGSEQASYRKAGKGKKR